MSLQQARLIFADMAEKLGMENGTLSEDGRCQIALREEWMPKVNVCYIAASDSLLIFSEIGFIPDHRHLEILDEVMRRQFLFDQSRDVVFAVDPGNGALMAQLKVRVQDLTSDDLMACLDDFIDEVRGQRISLYKDELGAAPAARGQDFPGLIVG